MLQEKIAIRHPMVCIGPFVDQNVDASQTDADLTIAGGDHTGVLMPQSGSIVGMSVLLNAAGSAGELTVGASIDGTEDSGTTQTITTAVEAIPTFVVDSDAPRFDAGEQIGAQITTDASWNGTTADLVVWLWVVYDDWEF